MKVLTQPNITGTITMNGNLYDVSGSLFEADHLCVLDASDPNSALRTGGYWRPSTKATVTKHRRNPEGWVGDYWNGTYCMEPLTYSLNH